MSIPSVESYASRKHFQYTALTEFAEHYYIFPIYKPYARLSTVKHIHIKSAELKASQNICNYEQVECIECDKLLCELPPGLKKLGIYELKPDNYEFLHKNITTLVLSSPNNFNIDLVPMYITSLHCVRCLEHNSNIDIELIKHLKHLKEFTGAPRSLLAFNNVSFQLEYLHIIVCRQICNAFSDKQYVDLAVLKTPSLKELTITVDMPFNLIIRGFNSISKGITTFAILNNGMYHVTPFFTATCEQLALTDIDCRYVKFTNNVKQLRAILPHKEVDVPLNIYPTLIKLYTTENRYNESLNMPILLFLEIHVLKDQMYKVFENVEVLSMICYLDYNPVTNAKFDKVHSREDTNYILNFKCLDLSTSESLIGCMYRGNGMGANQIKNMYLLKWLWINITDLLPEITIELPESLEFLITNLHLKHFSNLTNIKVIIQHYREYSQRDLDKYFGKNVKVTVLPHGLYLYERDDGLISEYVLHNFMSYFHKPMSIIRHKCKQMFYFK